MLALGPGIVCPQLGSLTQSRHTVETEQSNRTVHQIYRGKVSTFTSRGFRLLQPSICSTNSHVAILWAKCGIKWLTHMSVCVCVFVFVAYFLRELLLETDLESADVD